MCETLSLKKNLKKGVFCRQLTSMWCTMISKHAKHKLSTKKETTNHRTFI